MPLDMLVFDGATLTEDRFGNPNRAFQFDGLDDYISIGDNEIIKPEYLTITSWIKTSSLKTECRILRYRTYGYGLLINAESQSIGQIKFSCWPG